MGIWRPSMRDSLQLRRFASATASENGNTDRYWPYVVSALNFPGADASTSIIDLRQRIWTPSGNFQVDTSLGYNAALLDGTGDYATTPYVAAIDDWWRTDYTIEAWILPTNLTTWFYVDGVERPAMLGNADPASTTSYWALGPGSTGLVGFNYWNGTTANSVASTEQMVVNKIGHLAMSHKLGTGIYIAVNGVVTSPTAVSGTPQSNATYPLVLGQINSRSCQGWVIATRQTQAARYTASRYLPPPPPFPGY